MSNPRKYIAKKERVDPSDLDLSEKVVFINRVAKVMKGGRRFHFTAIVVVGDMAGHVGAAMGKATEVPEAIRKAGTIARKHMISVPMSGTTVPAPAARPLWRGEGAHQARPARARVLSPVAACAPCWRWPASRMPSPSRSAPTTQPTLSRPRCSALSRMRSPDQVLAAPARRSRRRRPLAVRLRITWKKSAIGYREQPEAHD